MRQMLYSNSLHTHSHTHEETLATFDPTTTAPGTFTFDPMLVIPFLALLHRHCST